MKSKIPTAWLLLAASVAAAGILIGAANAKNAVVRTIRRVITGGIDVRPTVH